MGTKAAIEAVLAAVEQMGSSTASEIERHPQVAAACRAAKLKARKLLERMWREGRVASCGSAQAPRYWTREGDPAKNISRHRLHVPLKRYIIEAVDSTVLVTTREKNMLKLTISATTSTEAIEAEIPFIDMREHAIEMRDMAAAVLEEQGDQEVLDLHDIDGVTVLYSPTFGYAYVNEMSSGVGDSLLIGNGEADSPEFAAQQWRTEGA
jgi:hypothetical protein